MGIKIILLVVFFAIMVGVGIYARMQDSSGGNTESQVHGLALEMP